MGMKLVSADFSTWEAMPEPSERRPAQLDAERALLDEDDSFDRFNSVQSEATKVLFLTIAGMPVMTTPFSEARPGGAPVARIGRVLRALANPEKLRARCSRILTSISAITQAIGGGNSRGRMSKLMPDSIIITLRLILDGRHSGVPLA